MLLERGMIILGLAINALAAREQFSDDDAGSSRGTASGISARSPGTLSGGPSSE